MRYVVGITGASGVVIGARLVEELSSAHDCHVIVTDAAHGVMEQELGHWEFPGHVTVYGESDQTAPFNSSSHLPDAMVIAPCSLKSLASVALGLCHNLLARTAINVIRCNRPLVVAPRETPLPTAALEHMLALRREGVVILPPMVAYYHHPRTVEDITDFFVGKILDQLGLEHELYHRWEYRPHSSGLDRRTSAGGSTADHHS
ncbi:UbiX family flavin prenyltransferase [bacterium]|nr:UbiX family flavin prenyltransferase [candidate division CSSED10-310 bacterium]